MAAKNIWKNLDEFYGDPQVEVQRQQEFDPAVNRAVADLRQGGLAEASASEPLAAAAGEATWDQEDPSDLRNHVPRLSRRGFLQLTGAASVFAMTGCWHDPPATLVPYHRRPAGHVLGKADYYSTVIRDRGADPTAVVAKLYDYRPIKLEGNPDAPSSLGRLDLRGQAALLDLYDPDRWQQGPAQRNEKSGLLQPKAWTDLDQAVGAVLADGAKRIGMVLPPIDGPANRAFVDGLQATLGERLRLAHFDPFAPDRVCEARRLCFGERFAGEPVYHVDQAAVLVSLGSDFLADHGLAEHIGFGEQRKLVHEGAHAEMGRYVAFEPTVSQAGTCADLRVRVPLEQMAAVAWALAVEVAKALHREADLPSWAGEVARTVPAEVRSHPVLEDAPGVKGADPIVWTAESLVAAHRAGHKSLIYAGGPTHAASTASLPLLVAANVLNHLLGNEGVTVDGRGRGETRIPASLADTRALLDAAVKGEIDALFFVDVNPLRVWPDLRSDRLVGKTGPLAQVPLVVALADRENETAAEAHWLAPTTHALETWGDAEIRAGEYALQQPVVAPMWDCRSWADSLSAFAAAAGFADYVVEADTQAAEERSAASRTPLWNAARAGVVPMRERVLATWAEQVYQAVAPAVDAATFVRSAQSRGAVNVDLMRTAEHPTLDGAAIAGQRPPAAAGGDGFTLICSGSRVLADGTSANNAWLQETPDPVSKVTWDNYLALAISDARALGLGRDEVVEISLDGERWHALPAMVQPGQAAGTVETFFGWGRDGAGIVARDGGGVDGRQLDAFALVAGGDRWRTGVKVRGTGRSYKLASTQFHQYMDGRDIARDDTLEMHRQDPDGHLRAHHHLVWKGGTSPDDAHGSDHNLNLWDSTHVYPGRRWSMVIDLNSCTGCNACVVACTAENNVPVVGRDEVRLGREMHWMRIDRYYTATRMKPKDSRTKQKESEQVEAEDPEDVEVFHQPMLCQQCDHAPCEEVCPAMATMHNDEGINVQVYNRCIGTRYCANNCPYKVRRFNFYEYGKYRFGPRGSGDPLGRIAKNIVTEFQTSGRDELLVSHQPLEMMLNPLVTVRSKGVMEKCNFCLQRTREIREEEKRTNRKYEDGSITTACAQTCPTRAIVFGDINDPESEVRQLSEASPRGYRVLDAVLNTRPSVDYLRKVRNRPSVAHEAEALHHRGGDGHGGGEDHGSGEKPKAGHGDHHHQPANDGPHGGDH